MIIQIRGTSGSGKSTVMREVMKRLGPWKPEYVEGRRNPVGYWIDEPTKVVVLGHYESPCGGCDTIGSARQIYDQILVAEESEPEVILCEGLLLSEDSKWTSQMFEPRVIFLTTPLDVCIKRIKARRLKAGNLKKLNETNTSNRVAVIERARQKLEARGIQCRRASSRQAPGIILRWLGVKR